MIFTPLIIAVIDLRWLFTDALFRRFDAAMVMIDFLFLFLMSCASLIAYAAVVAARSQAAMPHYAIFAFFLLLP